MDFHENHQNPPKLTKTTITHGFSRKPSKLTRTHENHHNTWNFTKTTQTHENPLKHMGAHESTKTHGISRKPPKHTKIHKNTWEFTNPRCRRRPTALLHPALRLPLRPRASSDDWRCNPPRRQYLAANAPTCLPTYLPPADALLPCS